MPTLKAYVGKEGYYINARPSDVGNVTYQVDPSIWEFLEEMDYGHESEIEWGLIKPFRLAGLIYTENGGVDDIGDDIPELDPTKLSTLSAEAIEKLLEYIDSRGDLSPSIKKKIKSYVREHGTHESTGLADEIHDTASKVLDGIGDRFNRNSIDVSVDSKTVQQWRITDIEMRIEKTVSFPSPTVLPEIIHTISIIEPTDGRNTENYTTWETEIDGDYSWDVGIEALEQKAALAEELKELLTEQGLKLGGPPKLV
ncbi:hypothetical protein [Halohasta salina]|uniref:hypothetical protein n=1 Tax=Halohasta salina TaxID=2961621 RepID=UPI0020A4E483|nr:hypothetical protein [Halohasta salina]